MQKILELKVQADRVNQKNKDMCTLTRNVQNINFSSSQVQGVLGGGRGVDHVEERAS